MTTQHRLACLLAILSGGLLTISGCGIPKLRSPLPGPAMPVQYNWNNGVAFWQVDERPSSLLPAPEKVLNKKESDDEQTNKDGNSNDEQNELKLKAPQPDAADAGQTDSDKHPNRLVRFVQAVGFLKPVNQDDQESKLDKEIEELEQRIENEDNAERRPASPAVTAALPLGPNFGLIDTDVGPTDPNRVIAAADTSAQIPYAAFYNDPYLLSLITETLTGNQELKILYEEIRIASNEAYARSGEYRPFVTLGAEAGLEKSGRHTRDGAVEDQLLVAPGTEFPDPLGKFAVGANLSWELDIWHRLRNSQRAAAMRYLATGEGRNFIVTRVVADVAENYYELLALDNRLQILQATIDIQQQSLQVAQAKKAAGRETELSVQRFQAEVQKNVSERSLIQQQIVETENRINFLAGRYPQSVERINTDFVNLNLNALGAGVPSELLMNRPDIREAERRVAAAGLDVKVARARFYPSLDLRAGLGWEAFSMGYLFRTPESLAYGVAGELVGPLINKRAIQAQYCSANAAQLQAIYNYQQTVLEAHIEVVNQITKIENFRRGIEVKKRQLEALEASVEVAGKLFQNARAEYVEVLLAQRELMEARMELIETKREQLTAVVTAYQALGGGGF
ncbi:MAG: TolC family protein [Pirellulaceae bacterium]